MSEQRGTFWGRLSLSQKIIIPTIVGFVLLTAILLLLLSYINVNTIVEAEDEQLRTAYAAFETVITDRSKSALALAYTIAEQNVAQAAFAAQDRETLAELYLPVYQSIDASFGIPQAQFHLPPATSFLRLHDPTAYGDDLSTFRQTVVDANALQQPISGIEVGRGGPGIRGVVPMFHEGEHIGTFEIGLNIDVNTLNELKNVYHGDWHIILNPRAAGIATLENFQITEPGPVENTLSFASTAETYVPVNDPLLYNDVLANGNARIDRVTVGENHYAVFVAPLYDYKNNVIGAVQIDLNRNAVATQIQQMQLQATALGVAIALVSASIIYFIIQRSLKPIQVLTAASNEIAQGNWDVKVDVQAQDEVGVLAAAFGSMVGQVRQLLTSLENRVAARTADLETSAEIATAANQVRELDDLISLTVNLVRDRFNFYYVQVYLNDPDNKFAVLKDGTGYVGRRLLVKEHRLPLDGHSLVARAINTGEVVIVQDTSKDAEFLPNELLPETKAEITIPLRTKNAIIGALDIQHNEVNAFDESARQLFSTLAEQLAVTFENVQLFEDTERRARELETVAEVSIEASTNLNTNELLEAVVNLTRDNFGLYHAHIYLLDDAQANLVLSAGASEIGRQMVAQGHSIPLDREHSLVARAARTRSAVVVNDVTQAPDFQPNKYLPNTRSEMAIPMVVGDTLVGVLDVQADIINRFTDEDVRVKTTLALQIAVAIQNARSHEETQTALNNLDRVYSTSIDMIGTANAKGYFIQLNPAWEQTLGFSKAELMAEPFISFVHPDDVDMTLAEAAKVNDGIDVLNFENRYRCKDGSYKWVAWRSRVDMETGQIHFVARDVTDDKVIEQERIERNAQLTEALEIARMGYWEFDFATGMFTFNDHFYGMLGTTAKAEGGYQMTAEHYATKYVHPDDAAIVAANVQAAYETDDPNFAIELEARNIRTDGSIMTVTVRLHVVKDKDGKTIKMIGANQDITERKVQEEELRRNREQLSDALRTAQLGYWEFDFASGNFIFTDEFYALIGTSAEAEGGYAMPAEVYAQRFVHPDEQEIVNYYIQQAVTSDDPNYTADFVTRSVRTSGAVTFDRVKFRVEKDADGNPIRMIGANQDITQQKQQEEELVRQGAILENSRDFISMTDLKGNVIYLNPGGRDMVEMARDASLKDTVIASFHAAEDVERIEREGIPVAFETGLWRGENRLKTSDGRYIPVDQTIFIIRDEDGNPQNLATIMTDITERKAAEQQIRRRAAELQTVAEVSTEAATNLNVDDLLWSVSNLTKDSFGLYHAHIYLLDEDRDNLVLAAGAGEAGQQMVSKGHSIPLDRKDSLVARAARTEGGVMVNDVTKAPDFLPNPLLPETRSEMAIPMMASGKVIGVLDVQSNIADRFTEEDVRVKTTLATQIAIAIQNARAYAYQQETAERLRDLDRLKSEFLANMSHELRTPLNSIIGYSEIMLDGIDGDLTEDAIEDVKAIHGSGQHLLNIINDILDLAKIEAGRMQVDRQQVNLVGFAREIMRAGEILVKDKPVELIVETETEELDIYADPVRLRQIIWNIMSNAVKFTEQGNVTLALGRDADSDNMAYVRISDTGIGMNKQDLPEIFEQFRQVDGSSTRRAGGTGLGLNITRHLVHMHEGEITVDSEMGVGTTFVVKFPLYDEAKVQAKS